MSASCDIGLIGLAVMGENLVLNMESRGYRCAVHNRTTSKVDEFIAGRAKGKNFVGCHSQLLPLLEAGDILIDGGNTYPADTERRLRYVATKGIHYIGTGVSGGEEGALKGPSIMPGGSEEAWPAVKPIFQAIAAKVGPKGDIPCCEWIGPGGAGNYVKMVHNGIEYGDMQLICEAYSLLKDGLGLSNQRLHEVFTEWNKGELDSYLIEITRDIFTVKDSGSGKDLVDVILDTAGQKGTGKWMSQLALDLGVPTTLVTEAVFARCLSAQKSARGRASKILKGPEGATEKFRKEADEKAFIDAVRDALYASKIVSYAQGFVQLEAAAQESGWDLKYGEIAMLWRGGCIIRAAFLERIKEAFDRDSKLENLLLDDYFRSAVEKAQGAWRTVVGKAVEIGIPVPCFTTALAYYDGYRSERLPANLLQAQRDYFGAHTYQRLDREGSFHTDWIRERTLPKE
jgi:6-phosphogluconate dehydrogenase